MFLVIITVQVVMFLLSYVLFLLARQRLRLLRAHRHLRDLFVNSRVQLRKLRPALSGQEAQSAASPD